MTTEEARKILGTNDPYKEYRRLSKIHHPDVGGDAETFYKIRDAYEYLIKGEPTAEYDLLAQLFLQELDISKVHAHLNHMETGYLAELDSLPAKKLKLKQARPIAKGFLMTILESAILNVVEDERHALHSISEIKKARTLLEDLYGRA